METVTRAKRKSYSAAEKSLLLEAYKTSGLSCKQWCTENHIGLSTLQRWMQKAWEKNSATSANLDTCRYGSRRKSRNTFCTGGSIHHPGCCQYQYESISIRQWGRW